MKIYHVFALLFVLLTTSMGCSTIINKIGGDFDGKPSELWAAIKDDDHAKDLINNAFVFDPKYGNNIIDYHVHVIGVGHNFNPDPETFRSLETDECEIQEPYKCNLVKDHECNSPPCAPVINKKFKSWKYRLKFLIFLSAMKITEIKEANEQYKERLKDMVINFRPANGKSPMGKFCIFAMDAYHDDTGKINWKRTDLYIPNDYVVKLAEDLNDEIRKDLRDPTLEDFFIPVISLHPLREDAVGILRHYADRKGVRLVKWLPSAMNIDPASYTSAPFLAMMAEEKMILLTHTGDEESLNVEDEDHQKYGNPMRLKQALDLGVTVVMQHSGRVTGKIDADYSYITECKKDQNFELFKEMMKKDFKGQLFGEIAALTVPGSKNNSQNKLIEISEKKELHGRMVNGSDYPIPAVNISRATRRSSCINKENHITPDDRKALNMIYRYNPLLFDFVVKRTIKYKDSDKLLIPESMFMPLDINQ